LIKGKFAYMSPEQSIGAELDARSDLFSVGTVLYLLATGRKPFEGATDLDVLMQVRKARYEKPSTLVRDFNPEVERFIARALRADRSRRWQSAEQMADRIDAILLKLGQTTGPSALKRWLDNLTAKDGAKPPAEAAEQASTSGTIELGSRDLELEEVAPSPETAETAEGPDEEEVSTRAPSRRPLRSSPPPAVSSPAAKTGSATGTAAVNAAIDVAAPPSLPRPLPQPGPRLQAKPATERAGGASRRVARAVLIGAMAMTLLGGSAYLARRYLFTHWVHPVESWLQQRLPAPVQGPDWTGDPREPVPESRGQEQPPGRR
jgi:serine/threonine-protein kinase